jgi:HD-like signal output (HDOD) protein
MIARVIPREMLLHFVKTLPAAPMILAELGHMLLDINADLGAVSTLLKRDAALTARVIRISNSVFYNPGRPHGSLEEALARVGFGEVYRLAGLAAAAQITEQHFPFYGVTGAQMRENSVLTALIMEAAAERAGADARTAYTAGLLRSVGKIALDRLSRSSVYAGGNLKSARGPLVEFETGVIGLTNCEAAGTILAEWRFPPEIVNAIRDHYAPALTAPAMTALLNLSAGAAEQGGYGLPGEAGYWSGSPAVFEAAGIGAEQMDAMLGGVLRQFESIRSALA